MNTTDKLRALRQLMYSQGWDAVIITGSDPHSSEYISPRWQARKWISGFTGSAGSVVVTHTEAGLWTDSRYFIQAEKELAGSGILLHRLRMPATADIPQWIGERVKNGGLRTIVIDGLCMSNTECNAIEAAAGNDATIMDVPDFISRIWEQRPGYPEAPAETIPVKYTGRSRKDKMQWLRETTASKGADMALISSLDEIAWLMNIRGGDIDYNPLVLSYLCISSEDATLFADSGKFTAKDLEELISDGVRIMPYEDVDRYLQENAALTIMVDGQTLNCHLYRSICNNSKIVDVPSPVPLEKSMKNSREIAGMKKAAIMDGIAMTRFMIWLEDAMKKVSKGQMQLSETDAADKLWSFRKAVGAIDSSFGTISAYGKNAALPHYSAKQGECSMLEPRGLYLVDSGGQYPFGTTDITRTIPLGPLTRQEKIGYTLVLKGMIDLAMAVFPAGTAGTNLDILARNPLWMHRMNFGHGVGHGVGHRLCVHEGPQAIRHNWVNCELRPGMITSDEPGLYVEGAFGIRHENLLLCRETKENGFGKWLTFETITYTIIDPQGVDVKLLGEQGCRWLEAYNMNVYRKLSRYLTVDERKWLKKKSGLA